MEQLRALRRAARPVSAISRPSRSGAPLHAVLLIGCLTRQRVIPPLQGPAPSGALSQIFVVQKPAPPTGLLLIEPTA